MPIKSLQNFYKTTIAIACGEEVGKIYVTVLPTLSEGFLVINPKHLTKREIIEYNAKGTDGAGNYIYANRRGLGGTTAQPHDVGEPVRMNLTAQHWEEVFRKDTDGHFDAEGKKIKNLANPTTENDAVNKAYADTKVAINGEQTIHDKKIFSTIPETTGGNPILDNQLARKKYVDDVAIAGAPNASATVKGISKLSVDPADPTNPIALGPNDPIIEEAAILWSLLIK